MRFLVSTTIGHNPGDELILEGVMNLIRAIKPDTDFVIYNRNPDLQVGNTREARVKTVGNYQCGSVDLTYIDGVVLAGSPEWRGGPLKALFEALKKRPDIPVYAIGIGAGEPYLNLSDLDREILRGARVTTRSNETTELLRKEGIGSIALPCPAIFSSKCAIRHVPTKRLLQIAQKPGHGWHEINPKCLTGMNPEHDVLCVHVKELRYFTDLGFKCKYASNPQEFRRIVKQYQYVASTRLHGAIGALAIGIPSIVIADGDYRITTAAKMFAPYLPIYPNFNWSLFNHESIAPFKQKVWSEYQEILNTWFK